MVISVEKTAKTEEEAIAAALSELGVSRDEATVEVLEKAKSGFLGIGSAPAVVRVSCQREETKEEKLEAFLTGLFEHMHVEVTQTTLHGEDGSINVDLSGEDMGSLIGRRGETLDAIQHLANYAVNRGDGGRVRINIDAENYRAKRTESLRRLADKVAQKVIKYRRSMTLEPMNAYERHIIHTTLQEYESITTHSTGTEPNRRVVVSFDRQKKTTVSDNGYTSREWR
ncbi:MAG: protein jag [Oscillospiraceae bacterium]|nr:protein jag [Oscillospiraceae bacterium]